MKQFYAYIYYRADGITPFYVGKGPGNRASRFDQHHNKWCKSIIRKDGENNIKIEILYCKDEQEALAKEIELIAKLRKDFKLCNMTNGGEGISGYRHTEEEKQRRREARQGKTSSKETREKQSKSLSGEKNPNFNKDFSEETRKRMSDAKIGEKNHNYGKPRREDTKVKMRKPRNEETKKKLRKPKTEEHKQHMRKPKTEEHKQHMREAQKDAWVLRKARQNNLQLQELQ